MNQRQARVAVLLGFTLITSACGSSGLVSDGPHDVLPTISEPVVFAPYNPAFPNDEIANTPDADQDLVRADLALLSYFGDARDFWALAGSPRVPECSEDDRSDECDVAMLQKLAILYRTAGLRDAAQLISAAAVDETFRRESDAPDPLQLVWAAGGREKTIAAIFGLSRIARAGVAATASPFRMLEFSVRGRSAIPCIGLDEGLAFFSAEHRDAWAYGSPPPECRSACEHATEAATMPIAQRAAYLVSTCGPLFFGVQDATAANMFAVYPYSVPRIRAVQFGANLIAHISQRGDRLAATFAGPLLAELVADARWLRVPSNWPATFALGDERVALATSAPTSWVAQSSMSERVYLYATNDSIGVGATPWFGLDANGMAGLGGNALPGTPTTLDALSSAVEQALTVAGCAPPPLGETETPEQTPADTSEEYFTLVASGSLPATRISEVVGAMDAASVRDPCSEGSPWRAKPALVVYTSTGEGTIRLASSTQRADATVDGRGAGTIRIGNGPARPLTATNLRGLRPNSNPVVKLQMPAMATLQDVVTLAARVSSLVAQQLGSGMRVSIAPQ